MCCRKLILRVPLLFESFVCCPFERLLIFAKPHRTARQNVTISAGETEF